MRLSAGEALAVLHEASIAAFGDDFRFPNQQHLLNMFATLATDSLKCRAKKDRRVQRFTFRQMFAAIKVTGFVQFLTYVTNVYSKC